MLLILVNILYTPLVLIFSYLLCHHSTFSVFKLGDKLQISLFCEIKVGLELKIEIVAPVDERSRPYDCVLGVRVLPVRKETYA